MCVFSSCWAVWLSAQISRRQLSPSLIEFCLSKLKVVCFQSRPQSIMHSPAGYRSGFNSSAAEVDWGRVMYIPQTDRTKYNQTENTSAYRSHNAFTPALFSSVESNLSVFPSFGAVHLCRREGSRCPQVPARSEPNKWIKTWLKRWSLYASKWTLMRFVLGENVIRLR